jgi:sulfite exporter TauE/SafE
MTTPLLLIFMGGLLGSAHCVGMCGGFVVGIGLGSKSWGGNLARQLVYSLGRVCTYILMGAMSGFAGFWADQRWHHFVNIQATLSLVAGSLLILQGCWHLGLLRSGWFQKLSHGPLSGPVCQAAGQFGALLKSPGLSPVFVAGVMTGFLPCGLVYANLGLAAGSASLFGGATTMAAFGLGTIPLLFFAGMGAGVASPRLRGQVMKVAAVCVIVTGLVTLSRAYTGFTASRENGGFKSSCPFCVGENSP